MVLRCPEGKSTVASAHPVRARGEYCAALRCGGESDPRLPRPLPRSGSGECPRPTLGEWLTALPARAPATRGSALVPHAPLPHGPCAIACGACAGPLAAPGASQGCGPPAAPGRGARVGQGVDARRRASRDHPVERAVVGGLLRAPSAQETTRASRRISSPRLSLARSWDAESPSSRRGGVGGRTCTERSSWERPEKVRHIHGTDPTPTFRRSDAVTRPPEPRKAGRAQGAGRATGARGAGRHVAGDGAYGRPLLLWRSALGWRSRPLVPCRSLPTRSAAPRSAEGHARARSPRCKAPAAGGAKGSAPPRLLRSPRAPPAPPRVQLVRRGVRASPGVSGPHAQHRGRAALGADERRARRGRGDGHEPVLPRSGRGQDVSQLLGPQAWCRTIPPLGPHVTAQGAGGGACLLSCLLLVLRERGATPDKPTARLPMLSLVVRARAVPPAHAPRGPGREPPHPWRIFARHRRVPTVRRLLVLRGSDPKIAPRPPALLAHVASDLPRPRASVRAPLRGPLVPLMDVKHRAPRRGHAPSRCA